jgi:serine/threonine protein kinase
MKEPRPPTLQELPVELVRRVEAICTRFEQAWAAGGRPELEEHLQQAPAEARPVLLAELLRVELSFRQRAGEVLPVTAYRQRFAQEATVVDAVIDALGSDPVETLPPLGSNPEGNAPGQTDSGSGGTVGNALAEAERASPALPSELENHPRYRVLAFLGRGGMGAVYKAEHKIMERCVALKMVGQDLDARPELVQRFRREVKAAARLAHPNIVTAYDAEQAGRTHFLVMEYVEGTDLARLVARRGKLPIEEACEYVRQAACGLQHAHEQGMTHRDIKPHNLMVTPAGQVKILDFGLALFAREAGAESDALTSQGAVMGTADYMAPEQASDAHHADIRADIYSLGCTLYHLLAGGVPFPKGTFLDKVVRHATKEPTPISQLRPDLLSELVRVVERMMAKKPEQRYQSPAEVAQALAPFAKGHTSASVAPDRAALFSALMLSKTEIGIQPPGIGRSHSTPVPAVHPLHRQRRSRFVALTLLVLLLVGLIAGATAIYRIQTDKGELVITTESDDVKVVISQGGKLVDVIAAEGTPSTTTRRHTC